MVLARKTRTRTRPRGRLTRRRAIVATAGLLLAATALTSAPLRAGADIETGSVSMSTTGTIPTYPCSVAACPYTFAGVASGSVSGVDAKNVPFTMAWGGAPAGVNAQVTVTMQGACEGSGMPPVFTTMAATSTTQGVLQYGTNLPQMATISATLYADTHIVDDTPTLPILGATFTASVGGTTVLNFQAGAAGAFNFVPIGNDLCPVPSSMPFALADTTASIL